MTATITTCLHEACIFNDNQRCTAPAVEIDEYLHCSSWRITSNE
jgi:hypothetical protein